MEIYTVEQVAEKLSVGVYTIRDWLKTGKLHGHKIGSLWRITSKDIEVMLQSTKSNDSKNLNNVTINMEPKEDSDKRIIKKMLLDQLALISEASEDSLEMQPELLPELTKEMVNVSTFLMEYCE